MIRHQSKAILRGSKDRILRSHTLPGSTIARNRTLGSVPQSPSAATADSILKPFGVSFPIDPTRHDCPCAKPESGMGRRLMMVPISARRIAAGKNDVGIVFAVDAVARGCTLLDGFMRSREATVEGRPHRRPASSAIKPPYPWRIRVRMKLRRGDFGRRTRPGSGPCPSPLADHEPRPCSLPDWFCHVARFAPRFSNGGSAGFDVKPHEIFRPSISALAGLSFRHHNGRPRISDAQLASAIFCGARTKLRFW